MAKNYTLFVGNKVSILENISFQEACYVAYEEFHKAKGKKVELYLNPLAPKKNHPVKSFG